MDKNELGLETHFEIRGIHKDHFIEINAIYLMPVKGNLVRLVEANIDGIIRYFKRKNNKKGNYSEKKQETYLIMINGLTPAYLHQNTPYYPDKNYCRSNTYQDQERKPIQPENLPNLDYLLSTDI